jgi:hypothetical protein
MKGDYKGKKMIERGPSKEKNGEKGAYKGQNKGNRLSKKIFFANIKKVPGAYESLDPALTSSYFALSH